MKNYPAPILIYKTARQRRVKQLERQRNVFLHQHNVVPYVARLPELLVPFGSDRFPSDISWAHPLKPDLFPPPLDLDALDLEQAKALRTWFVAHVEIQPRKVTPRKRKSQKTTVSDNFVQLSLLDDHNPT